MADGPIWWPKPPGRPAGGPAPYWNLELAGTRYDVCPLLLAKIYETQFEVE